MRTRVRLRRGSWSRAFSGVANATQGRAAGKIRGLKPTTTFGHRYAMEHRHQFEAHGMAPIGRGFAQVYAVGMWATTSDSFTIA
jgi:hypothetical protein